MTRDELLDRLDDVETTLGTTAAEWCDTCGRRTDVDATAEGVTAAFVVYGCTCDEPPLPEGATIYELEGGS